MTCKEKILSEDYIDLINYFILPQGRVEGNDDVFCYIPVNERFLSIYYSRADSSIPWRYPVIIIGIYPGCMV